MRISDRVKREIREWVESLIVALILALIIRTFVVQAFKIPTGSMIPTLLAGDRLLVNKFIYKFKEPERGDIIVFKYPGDEKKDFIKRLIATSGETVEIRNGDIYIDGNKVEDPFIIRKIHYYNKSPHGATGRKTEVPEDSYYVLGDNSASSRDSRYWGFVPRKNVIGKAFFLYWPVKRIRVIE
ncbi:MAG: signal peptidase I [Candidatus Omnitrophica bacterium]|nr:signal peptidase I [Candidatus Omnitrophota bacterium]